MKIAIYILLSLLLSYQATENSDKRIQCQPMLAFVPNFYLWASKVCVGGTWHHIVGLVQERCNSSVLETELHMYFLH